MANGGVHVKSPTSADLHDLHCLVGPGEAAILTGLPTKLLQLFLSPAEPSHPSSGMKPSPRREMRTDAAETSTGPHGG